MRVGARHAGGWGPLIRRVGCTLKCLLPSPPAFGFGFRAPLVEKEGGKRGIGQVCYPEEGGARALQTPPAPSPKASSSAASLLLG